MVKKVGLSMYDVEQFLRDAGAEKINEKAVISLNRELQDTVNSLIDEASLYANYAGRRKMIKESDINLANGKSRKLSKRLIYRGRILKNRRTARKTAGRIAQPQIMLINNFPVIREAQDISVQSPI